MEFTYFTTLVREEVERRTGDCYKVLLNDVTKNNGVVLRGLTVTQDDSNISPTIYLNNYYEEYIKGRATLLNVVNDVMDTYQRNKVNQSVDMRYFLDYERVKDSVVYKLINTEKNKELLEDIPHIEFMDLSIVFQCMVAQEDIGTASILIHNVHLKLWDVSIGKLYQAAKENTQRIQKYEIRSITEVLREITRAENPDGFDDDSCMEDFSDGVPMYVLSNERRVEGAACMLYPNLIRDFAEAMGSSFYIIPSSIHELLLLPTEHIEECGEIKNMIREINDTQVSIEEMLSYSLYLYDKDEGKIIQL
ncbi:MAG: hypothetical protein K2O40_01250 [Lachnospiraceae bacterium]|nr:hypothetical protein [Lachnospiraceae bacterium]MDE7183107.1 hypothetical protein [Lachnospiraceae bacterium]